MQRGTVSDPWPASICACTTASVHVSNCATYYLPWYPSLFLLYLQSLDLLDILDMLNWILLASAVLLQFEVSEVNSNGLDVGMSCRLAIQSFHQRAVAGQMEQPLDLTTGRSSYLVQSLIPSFGLTECLPKP